MAPIPHQTDPETALMPSSPTKLTAEGIITSDQGMFPTKRPFKILMLHEHGSSGTRMFFKTRNLQPAIRSALHKHQRDVHFFFPNAPLLPDGFGDDNFTWGLGDYRIDRVPCLDRSVEYILEYMNKHGPFDGVVGTSAGCVLAVAIAAMLERPGRCAELDPRRIIHPPFRFILGFSGFVMEHPLYQGLYTPQICTPAMFIYGEVDTYISPELTERLAGRFANVETLTFWGGHYIPREKETDAAAVGFICRALLGEDAVQEEEEEVEEVVVEYWEILAAEKRKTKKTAGKKDMWMLLQKEQGAGAGVWVDV